MNVDCDNAWKFASRLSARDLICGGLHVRYSSLPTSTATVGYSTRFTELPEQFQSTIETNGTKNSHNLSSVSSL